MKCVLLQLRRDAKYGIPMIAHSVLEELIIYLCNEEAQAFIEVGVGADDFIDEEDLDNLREWLFDMFGDMDIITFLYSDWYLSENHPFHFEHWSDQQFYMGYGEQ